MPPILNVSELWIAQDSGYVSGSECARVLDVPGLWVCFCFWICQDPEYTRVLTMSGLQRVQNMLNNSRICLNLPNYVWICVNIPGYVWICRNMPEYAWICLNLPEWLLFYIFPFPHLFYNPLPTRTRGYLFERLQKVRGVNLGGHESWYTVLVFCFSLVKTRKKSRKIYSTSVKLLRFNLFSPSCMKSSLIIC